MFILLIIRPAWMYGKTTHYLVHGWLGSGNDWYLHQMKDNLLLQVSCVLCINANYVTIVINLLL